MSRVMFLLTGASLYCAFGVGVGTGAIGGQISPTIMVCTGVGLPPSHRHTVENGCESLSFHQDGAANPSMVPPPTSRDTAAAIRRRPATVFARTAANPTGHSRA